MLGFSALSENPISSVNKVLELSASMTGLAVSSSAAAGTLVGGATLSAISLQTSVGTRIQTDSSTLASISPHSASLESASVASSSAVFIKGSTLQTDLISSAVQTTNGIGILVGESTQDMNSTQTTVGEKLFDDLVTEDTSLAGFVVTLFPDLNTQTNTETFTDLNTHTNTETFTDLVT